MNLIYLRALQIIGIFSIIIGTTLYENEVIQLKKEIKNQDAIFDNIEKTQELQSKLKFQPIKNILEDNGLYICQYYIDIKKKNPSFIDIENQCKKNKY